MENEFGITREMILEIAKATAIAMKRLKRYKKYTSLVFMIPINIFGHLIYVHFHTYYPNQKQ